MNSHPVPKNTLENIWKTQEKRNFYGMLRWNENRNHETIQTRNDFSPVKICGIFEFQTFYGGPAQNKSGTVQVNITHEIKMSVVVLCFWKILTFRTKKNV